MLMKSKLIYILLFSLVICNSCKVNNHDQPLIFAAASLHDVLLDLSLEYEKKFQRKIRFNFGGSNSLATQIKSYKAPADGVIFSGSQPLNLLLESEHVRQEDIFIFCENLLVLAWLNDKNKVKSISELVSKKGKIAIADKNLAPAGLYSYEALNNSGILDEISNRLIYLPNVRNALYTLSTGNADYAMVYLSDLKSTEKKFEYILIDNDYYSQIFYPMSSIIGSELNSEVELFFKFLRSNYSKNIFIENGFIVD